jgi:hypothetical protein
MNGATRDPTWQLNRVAGAILLVTLAFFAAVTMQRWVGGETIYAKELEARRLQLHVAILNNRPPSAQTWESLGAQYDNVRIGSVWLAEGVHRAIGMSIAKTYFVIDTLFMWITLMLLFVLLEEWVDCVYSLLGLLYFISVLPLTYIFYYFHPWDRPSQALWVLLLLCVKKQWKGRFAAVLALSMFVKYDTVLAPLLYWLGSVRRDRVKQATIFAAVMFAMSFGILYFLVARFPEGASVLRDIDFAITKISRNLKYMIQSHVMYPPVLAHLLPAVLVPFGWTRADQAARAAALFGGICLVPIWFIESNFEEVRAEVPLIILLLPTALLGLQRLVEARRKKGGQSLLRMT